MSRERGDFPRLDTLVAGVLRAVSGLGADCVVLIDGPSGAGKSTLAGVLQAQWPGTGRESAARGPTLVRLDDIYPGWEGLDAAIDHLTSQVLLPRRAGRPAAWRRYDWARDEPAEWHTIDPGYPLIVEGCGALAAANAGLSDVRVWLTADDDVRKRRALDRDGAAFESHWEQWQNDWAAYCDRESPQRWATITLTAG